MNPERKRTIQIICTLFLLFLLIYIYFFTGQQFLNACKPIFIGLFIAYPMNIMISWFNKHDFLYNRKIIKSRKLHMTLCIVATLIVVLGSISFIAFFMAPQLTACVITLFDKVPSGIRYLIQLPLFTKLIPPESLEALQQVDWSNWVNHIATYINSDDLFRGMTSTATSALSAFSTVLFGILFAIYFLSGRNRALQVSKRFVHAFVPEGRQNEVFRCGALLNDCFHNFIVCQATQALITGISATVLMHIFRMPYASMIGVMNGFAALLPVIGGYIGAILGTLMTLADAPGQALFYLIFIIILQNVIGTLVFPRLMGQSLGLPAVWTLAAVMIGFGLGGIVGILIGVPLTCFFYRLGDDMLKKKEAQKRKEGVPNLLKE